MRDRLEKRTEPTYANASAVATKMRKKHGAKPGNKDPEKPKVKIFRRANGTFDIVAYGPQKESKDKGKPADKDRNSD